MDKLSVTIDPSRAPERVRRAVWDALRAGEVPASVLYDSPAQSERWLAYHRAWSPSRRDGEVLALYGHSFRYASGRIAVKGARRLAGLGSGGGQKDAGAAEALRQAGPGELHYFPIDASEPLVREAARTVALRVPGIARHPLVADLGAAPALRRWMDERTGSLPTLFTCFGMLPNLDAERFAGYAAELLRPGDGLLISANLSPAGYEQDRGRILAQYDNAEARAWYAGALAELGLGAGQAELSVGAERLAPDGSAWRVVVDARAGAAAELRALGRTMQLHAGRNIRLFFSNRFTERAAREVLVRAGLHVQSEWLDRTGEEGIFWCESALER